MLMRSSVVPRGTWTESIGIPREVGAAPPGRTRVTALMPATDHGGKRLVGLQTPRRACPRRPAWRPVVGGSGAPKARLNTPLPAAPSGQVGRSGAGESRPDVAGGAAEGARV